MGPTPGDNDLFSQQSAETSSEDLEHSTGLEQADEASGGAPPTEPATEFAGGPGYTDEVAPPAETKPIPQLHLADLQDAPADQNALDVLPALEETGSASNEVGSLPDFEELPADKPAGWATAGAVAREVIETVVLTVIIFFLIQTVIKNFRVVGTSMEPNLHDGQYLIIDKISYRLRPPKRGEVVVFEPPNRPQDDYVKRIVGLPGDTVEVRNGQIFVNGELFAEEYGPRSGSYNYRSTVIGENQVFVLGDNRNNSNDSHNWGPLQLDKIVGRAWLSYWPPSQWGLIPSDGPTDGATLQSLLDN